MADTPRASPVRIVDLVPFAYELDILEIRLHELHAVVDVTQSLKISRTVRPRSSLSSNLQGPSKSGRKLCCWVPLSSPEGASRVVTRILTSTAWQGLNPSGIR